MKTLSKKRHAFLLQYFFAISVEHEVSLYRIEKYVYVYRGSSNANPRKVNINRFCVTTK